MMLSLKKGRIAMAGFGILNGVQHYVGKVRTMRNEIRTRRFLTALRGDIRKDMGGPDLYPAGRMRGHGGMMPKSVRRFLNHIMLFD